jgi:hypothetical protein
MASGGGTLAKMSHEKDTFFLHYQLRLPMYGSEQRPSGEWKALCPAIGMASEVRVPGGSDDQPADRRSASSKDIGSIYEFNYRSLKASCGSHYGYWLALHARIWDDFNKNGTPSQEPNSETNDNN